MEVNNGARRRKTGSTRQDNLTDLPYIDEPLSDETVYLPGDSEMIDEEDDYLQLEIEDLMKTNPSLSLNAARTQIREAFQKDVQAVMETNQKRHNENEEIPLLTLAKAKGIVYRKYSIRRWRIFFNQYWTTHRNTPDPERNGQQITSMARAMELAGKEYNSISKQKRTTLKNGRQQKKISLREQNHKIEENNRKIDEENRQRVIDGLPLLPKTRRKAIMPNRYTNKGREIQNKEEAKQVFQDCYLRRYELTRDQLGDEAASQSNSELYSKIEKMINAMRLNMTKNRLGRGSVGIGNKSKNFYCTKRKNKYVLANDFRGITTDQNECSQLYIHPFDDDTPAPFVNAGQKRCSLAQRHRQLLHHENGEEPAHQPLATNVNNNTPFALPPVISNPYVTHPSNVIVSPTETEQQEHTSPIDFDMPEASYQSNRSSDSSSSPRSVNTFDSPFTIHSPNDTMFQEMDELQNMGVTNWFDEDQYHNSLHSKPKRKSKSKSRSRSRSK